MNTPETILLEDVSCPLGCIKDDEVILKGKDLLHDLPGKFTVVKCRTCGLKRTNPRPTAGTIGFYYPADYGPYLGTQVRQTDQKKEPFIKKTFKPVVQRLMEFNTMRLPQIPQGDMLELGCASGAFLHQMAGNGWQVEGIEFSKEAAEAASHQGYKVYAGSLESAPTPDRVFDLTVGWMVVEHLHDPVGGLKKLHEWSKPDGWLVLSVPNANSLEFRFFKEKWYALQLPTHLYHFTPDTIKQLLQSCGWKVEKIHHHRVLSNVFASIGYVLRDKGYEIIGKKLIRFPQKAGRWNYFLYPLAWLLSLFGQTGRMTVWARRDV